MSSQPGPGKVFELLQSLATTVRELRDRAAKLDADFRTRLARDKLRQKGLEQEEETAAARELSAQATAYQVARAALNRKFESRKARILKAQQSSKGAGQAAVDKYLNARKYDAQKQLLQTERERETRIVGSNADGKGFRNKLETELQHLEDLERKARILLVGYRSLTSGFLAAYEKSSPEPENDHRKLYQGLLDSLTQARRAQNWLRRSIPFQLLRYTPVWFVVAGLPMIAAAAINLLRLGRFSYLSGVAASIGVLLVSLTLRYIAYRRASRVAANMSQQLARARRLHEAAATAGEAFTQNQLKTIAEDHRARVEEIDSFLNQEMADASEKKEAYRRHADAKVVRALESNERLHQIRVSSFEQKHIKESDRLKGGSAGRAGARAEALRKTEVTLEAEHAAGWERLQAEWVGKVSPICSAFEELNETASAWLPPWSDPAWQTWIAPEVFSNLATFGRADVDVEALSGGLPKDKRLAFPGPTRFPVALGLSFPHEGSALFETAETGQGEAIAALNNLILRLLAAAPPGRLNFSVIDPVRLGENFAGVMHLADYEAQLINGRIWTQSSQIEERLAELNAHMEKVIQMYLRNEYATIAEYNEQAGVIAEKYHFLVIADFPANFTETAIKRLMSIAASGARCGVYLLLHWDRRHPVPQEFVPDEVRKHCFPLVHKGGRFTFAGKTLPGVELSIDSPPSPEAATSLIQSIGEASRDSSRVEVPFQHVAPSPAEVWSEDTVSQLRVAIGRTGATKLQYLAIGKGTCQHGLIAGKTGSGKSTLFHVIITNLALWCSPEQVEFYLIDFKKGVEFKAYAETRLPHARVVAIESDREFGLSVLERVDEELKRRGDLFRKLGVQDLAGYKRGGGTEALPRSLLIIDEFQEFFVEDDKISQTASLLLDRIVRQGRAFGIHVLLGSQTLGGAYSVARTTLGQMVIRIALQCNEADAYLIMDENNPAPRLLSRPGEAIYNDMAGALEGNSPFQVVWLPDHERTEQLRRVRARADSNGANYAGPIVFEGNSPANIRENQLLAEVLRSRPAISTSSPRLWLGAANSIKGPTEAVFPPQGGSHLVMVGQNEETLLAMLSVGLIALSAQTSDTARFVVFDALPPDAPARRYLERVAQAIPHHPAVTRPGDVANILSELSAEMAKRSDQPESEIASPIFVVINGLQRFVKLRYEDEFSFSSPEAGAPVNPAILLNNLITEGGRLGIHVIVTIDTYNNVNRFLNRKSLSEFGMRVLLQMSATDSASLIDNPKASTLGMHRALFYSEHEGYVETFRPYALPSEEWVDEAGEKFSRNVVVQPGA